MGKLDFLIFHCSLVIFVSSASFSFAADSLSSGQSIRDGETLVSSGQSFELGFFSPGSSKNRYVGIWLKTIPDTVVWVANRNNPLTDSNGTLTISSEGNLVLLNQANVVIWSSNLSGTAKDPVALLLENGNLVLRNNSTDNSNAYLWQSFDYPTDTLLPDMKFGWDLKSGVQKYLTSWKSTDDPSVGDYAYKFNITGLPQVELIKTGSPQIIKFRTGPWNGIQFSGAAVGPTMIFKSMMVYNQTEIFFWSETLDSDYITKITLNSSGLVHRFVAKKRSSTWDIMYTIPYDACDDYGECGPNGVCTINQGQICSCLQGFIPKSPDEWGVLNWSSGCKPKVERCSTKEGFLKLSGVKLPDLIEFKLDPKMSLKECKAECLKNCACVACANSNITEGGSGCIMWFGNLIDIRKFQKVEHEQDIFIRLPASEIGSSDEIRKKKVMIIAVVSAICGLILLATIYVSWKRRMRSKGLRIRGNDIDLPLFDLATISVATGNFSSNNVIGAGGFGPVYKGTLGTGKEIAVKRLSNNSGQGLEEFMNEVVLIAKLQHRNLVGLLGCCIEREERMLIYEYMANKSLDYFIFDHDRKFLLGWNRRFDIILGIARGLLYLHQDSKLQIIHRDLKTSNVLLDGSLNPKISDFGLARIFEGDEKEARTKRVIGTYGYMSPEYAFDGKFSVKSDVYSFGVLLLEIVSGKRNRGFLNQDHHHNLLGHAWLLWGEDRALDLVDQSLEDSLVESQVKRCIHVALLCVQKFPEDRPTMSYVVSMLVTEGAILFQPKEPGFFMERSTVISDARSTGGEIYTGNVITITVPAGR